MTKEELKDEMKNRISMALKDPVLQQGFEIICKENTELEKENAELKDMQDMMVKAVINLAYLPEGQWQEVQKGFREFVEGVFKKNDR